jgi:hypothetical protein
MYPVSSAFLAKIRTTHIAPVRVELWDTVNNDQIAELQPLSGTVTVDSRRAIRRQCSLQFVDDDGTLTPETAQSLLVPFNRELRIYRGAQLGDGTQEMVPLGVFLITEVSISDAKDGIKIAVEGSDRSLRIARARWADNKFYIAADTAKETAIANILKDRWASVATQFPATGQTTATIYPTLDTSSDPWRQALAIADSAAMDLYFDVDGVCKMRPIPDPDTGTPVITYADGTDAVLTEMSRSLNTNETFNGVIYTGEGSNLALGIIGSAWDDNPQSPTYRQTYGDAPMFKSSPTLLTIAEANAAAAAELRKVIGATEKIEWGQIVNPAHDVFDLVQVSRGPSKVDAVVMLDSVSIPLEPAGTMKAVARSRRF